MKVPLQVSIAKCSEPQAGRSNAGVKAGRVHSADEVDGILNKEFGI